MACFGDKEKGEVDESQKWAYVTLSDFHANGALAYFSYAWLWFLAIVAVAVYAADTFTAVNLLAFDKWSSQIQPAIPFQYSKWIFAICIIISWLLCGFEWVRAIRVIRRGGVAESYMDPLAVTLQSMRPEGWKRFLVFAELTKSKKGVDYIALFVYFQFKGSIRVILAEGARQVVNALTLYSVMQADLVPTGSHAATSGHSAIDQFFINVEVLANTDREQAITLFTMLFTLCIWAISALSLIVALVFYLVFLWHYVPQRDGRLSIYCRRKIDRRLEKVVGEKVKKALADQEKKRLKDEAKLARGNDVPARLTRKPTLPQIAPTAPSLGNEQTFDLDLIRQESQAALPSYTSRSNTPSLQRQQTAPFAYRGNERPDMPSRSGTQASASSNLSCSSNAPLLGNATEMGYSNDRSYQHSQDDGRPFPPSYVSRLPPARSTTQSLLGSQRSVPYQYRPDPARDYSFDAVPTSLPSRPSTRQNGSFGSYGPPTRPNTQNSISRPENVVLQRKPTQTSFHRPFSPPVRSETATSFASRHNTPAPASHTHTYEMTSHSPPGVSPVYAAPPPPPSQHNTDYVAFNPLYSTVSQPRRTRTNPALPQGYVHAMPQRSVTAPPERGGYEDVIDEYSGWEHDGVEMAFRSATAGPGRMV